MPGSLSGQHGPEVSGRQHRRAALLAAAKERELQHLSLSRRDLVLVLSADNSTSPLTDLQTMDRSLPILTPAA